MSLFVIENRHKNSKARRIAFVYAKDREEATKKLLEKFPEASELLFIKFDQIIQSYSTCVIR